MISLETKEARRAHASGILTDVEALQFDTLTRIAVSLGMILGVLEDLADAQGVERSE